MFGYLIFSLNILNGGHISWANPNQRPLKCLLKMGAARELPAAINAGKFHKSSYERSYNNYIILNTTQYILGHFQLREMRH